MLNFREVRNAKNQHFCENSSKKEKIQLEFIWFLWNFSRNFASLSYFSLHSFSRKNAKFREKAMMTFPTLFIGFFIHYLFPYGVMDIPNEY